MIALACDHHGVALKQELMKMLDEMGLTWKDFGTYDANNPGDAFFGVEGAHALTGDFNGDGKDELAIFLDGYWFIDINRAASSIGAFSLTEMTLSLMISRMEIFASNELIS